MNTLDKIKLDLLKLKPINGTLNQIISPILNYFNDSDLIEIKRGNGIQIPTGIPVYVDAEEDDKNKFVEYADPKRSFIIKITALDLRRITLAIENGPAINGFSLEEDNNSSESVPVYKIVVAS